MEKYKLADGMEVPKEFSYEMGLFDSVDAPFCPLEHFLKMMWDVAAHESDEDALNRLDIAKGLFKQALSTIEKRFDSIQRKTGRIRIIYSTAKQDICPVDTFLDAEIIPLNGNGTNAKLDGNSGSVSDFRSIQPETEEEAQLQRVYEVMLSGGKEWAILEKSIDMCFNLSARKEA